MGASVDVHESVGGGVLPMWGEWAWWQGWGTTGIRGSRGGLSENPTDNGFIGRLHQGLPTLVWLVQGVR